MDYSDSSAASPSTTAVIAGEAERGGGRQRSSAGDSLILSPEGLAALLKSQVPASARAGSE